MILDPGFGIYVFGICGFGNLQFGLELGILDLDKGMGFTFWIWELGFVSLDLWNFKLRASGFQFQFGF